MIENKTIELVKNTKKTLKRYREPKEKLWKEEEEAYFGKIWKNSDGYRPYENYVFQVIESIVPILTDSYPSIAVKVDEPSLVPQVKNFQKAIDWVFEQQNFQLKLPLAVRQSQISAPSYQHVYYDANANNGEGEIKIENLNWRQVYLSGNSEFIEDCEKVVIELDRSKTWLKLNYSKFTDEIEKAKSEFKEKSSDNGDLERYDNSGYSKRDIPEKYQDEDMLVLTKTFIRDYSLEEIPEEDTLKDLEVEKESLDQNLSPNINKWENHKAHIEAHLQELAEIYAEVGLTPDQGKEAFEQVLEQILAENPESGVESLLIKVTLLENHIEEHAVLMKENPKGGRLKYPNGLRCIETLNDVILYDGKSRDEHNEIPLTAYYCYKDGTIYGYGQVRNILDSQRMQAVLQYKEYKGLQRVANPKVIVDKETGLTEDDITNEDGAIYVIPQGTNIRDVQPNSVSPQIGQFNNDRRRAISDISGVNEATQGKMPSASASGVTVERIQTQAIGRIRLIDRQNQRYSIKRLGLLIAKLIVQYWTEDKTLALENIDGEYEQIIFNPLEMQDVDYEIKIAEGSMAGVDKESFNGFLATLLNAGHLSFEEFTDLAEMPKMSKLNEIAKNKNQITAQLEQLQQENLLLKGQFAPQSLSKEEAEAFAQMQSNEQTGNQL